MPDDDFFKDVRNSQRRTVLVPVKVQIAIRNMRLIFPHELFQVVQGRFPIAAIFNSFQIQINIRDRELVQTFLNILYWQSNQIVS